jgi:glycosyltransferase involved in cell wall biosynthesis
MRIAQIILPAISGYESRAQRLDRSLLEGSHELVDDPRHADVVHVYGARAHLGRPPRWPWQRVPPATVVVTPENLPEAVDDRYFAVRDSPREPQNVVGSLARPSTGNQVEQTLHRIRRFREDVQWKIFASPPAPEDLAGVDLWVDPAVDETDYDGFVAEALVFGLPIVASRTAVNARRLEQGRTGMLVPLRDPNEMTHAILAGLFKREIANGKISAARQTVSKFRSRQRFRVLMQLYESLIP